MKLLDIKREMLNYILTRPYDIDISEPYPKLWKISAKYEDLDSEKRKEKKVNDVWAMIEKTFSKYEDPQANTFWELGYHEWYKDALNFKSQEKINDKT